MKQTQDIDTYLSEQAQFSVKLKTSLVKPNSSYNDSIKLPLWLIKELSKHDLVEVDHDQLPTEYDERNLLQIVTHSNMNLIKSSYFYEEGAILSGTLSSAPLIESVLSLFSKRYEEILDLSKSSETTSAEKLKLPQNVERKLFHEMHKKSKEINTLFNS
eukprot:snap_masked-scaffold_16-processed-gene-3.35-mRNA-1 protein AED:1.00 eAED:1.00 QI:0/-1/0/0/-1/1/1/0/158